MSLDGKIYEIAIKNGFTPKTAKLIVAQARLESASYTTDAFRLDNNVFGTKYVGQPLATKGSLARLTQRAKHETITNYHAKYQTAEDSVIDVIERLYNKTINGVSPEELKNADTEERFSELLKKRGFFEDSVFDYANAIKNKTLNMPQDAKPKEKEKITNRDILEVIVFIGLLFLTHYLLKKYGII